MRVAVLGAAGGIGQPLSLLLKQQLPPGSTLLLYDLTGVEGVALDLSHIDTDVSIEWAQGTIPPTPECNALKVLVKDADLVVVAAGIARKPGMTREDLLSTNAGVVVDLVHTCARVSPRCVVAIITNPINSLVPIVANALRRAGSYHRDRLFGITSLDLLRATAFLNEIRKQQQKERVADVPVVGGHSGRTIVPLFSQIPGGVADLSGEDLASLLQRVQQAGTEVVNAKKGKGSATLSMAAAGAMFVLQLVRGLRGDATTLTYAYVDITLEREALYKDHTTPQTTFLAVPITVGVGGIVQRHGIGKMLPRELDAWKLAIVELDENIALGANWAQAKL